VRISQAVLRYERGEAVAGYLVVAGLAGGPPPPSITERPVY
jgi:hypothetical protein